MPTITTKAGTDIQLTVVPAGKTHPKGRDYGSPRFTSVQATHPAGKPIKFKSPLAATNYFNSLGK